MPQCEAVRRGHPDKNEEPRQCRRNAVRGSKFCQAHGGSEDENRLPAFPRKEIGNTTQCTATVKRTGERCKRPAILGGSVCIKHGGKSPQVARKARQRMEELVGPAIKQLRNILEKPDTSDADRLRAIALLLDRSGFGPKSEVSVEVKPYEALVATIFKELPADIVDAEVIESPEEDDPEFDYGPAPQEVETGISGHRKLLPVPPAPPLHLVSSYPDPPRYPR